MINQKNKHFKDKLQMVINGQIVNVDCVYEYDMPSDTTYTDIHVCDGVDIAINNELIIKNDREVRN